ncbi:triose-phosphate isomerase [Candidatus Uhrbacteria bacterium]|nr:triose-phosphate isomerase [Candidatus Uhrbacteria bacterium]
MKWIIANWKMHYGPIKAGAWIRAFRRERLPKDVEIGVAVPHISLAAARASLGRASAPLLGAQNAFWGKEGAFTGETAPEMLQELGTSFCLVGHSERRIHLGETDQMVGKKVAALAAVGIKPVVCVGETKAQRDKKETLKVVKAQLTAALTTSDLLVAYEPVWAVGSGKACSPEIAKQMHESIREILKKKFGARAEQIPILYGGSVDENNIHEYFSTTDIDGVLVGGASLDPRTFGLLCRAAARG